MNLAGRGGRKKLGGVEEGKIAIRVYYMRKKSVTNKKDKRRLGKAFSNMHKLPSLSPTLYF